MANNLFPKGYETEVIEDVQVQEKKVGYRPSVTFDFVTGDFPRDGRYRMIPATGVEAAKQWCMKELLTERYKHLAYSTDRGVNYDAVFGAETRGMSESIFIREATEALTSDPYGRVMYVPEITIEWTKADAFSAHVTVELIYDVTIDFDVEILKAG